MGINVVRTRTLAFAIPAGFAGLAGGLFANFALFIDYETFTFNSSIEFLLMVILGGSGTVAGPTLLFLLSQILQDFAEWQTFASGLLLAVVLFVMSDGVVKALSQLARRMTMRHGSRERTVAPWPHFMPNLATFMAGGGPNGPADAYQG